MTILIGRSTGPIGPRVTFTSTNTGDCARMTPEEWVRFARRVKSGQLDHIEQALRAEQVTETWRGKPVSEMTTEEASAVQLISERAR